MELTRRKNFQQGVTKFQQTFRCNCKDVSSTVVGSTHQEIVILSYKCKCALE